MNQLNLFDGITYEPNLDKSRLSSQLQLIKNIMQDNNWHTIPELESKVNASGASISARIRDLRKQRFGGYNIERKRDESISGLWHYKLIRGNN